MSSFFAGFFHTYKDVTCSESGFMDLSTAQECSGAVSYAKSFNINAGWRFQGNWNGLPKGCIIADGGYVYFNTHSTGGRSNEYASICRKCNT